MLAVTAALWSSVLATVASDVLLAHGWSGWSAWRLLGQLLGCGLGAGMCLALERVARPHAPVALGPGIGALVLAASLLAIVWTLGTRLILFPLARVIVEAAGFSTAGPTDTHLATHVIALVFLTWGGAWLAVAFADDLAEEQRGAELQRARILELEEALAGNGADGVTHLWVPSRTGQTRIAVGDLTTITAERDYVRLRTAEGREHLVRGRLHLLLARLDPAAFAQVHRSAAVNLAHIEEVQRDGRGAVLLLAGGATAMVSRRFAAVLRQIEASFVRA